MKLGIQIQVLMKEFLWDELLNIIFVDSCGINHITLKTYVPGCYRI